MFQKVQEIVSVLIGLRKIIVMFALIVIGVIFRFNSYIDGQQFVDLLKGTVLGFFAANASEHVKTMVTSYVNSKGQTVKEVDSEAGDESNAK